MRESLRPRAKRAREKSARRLALIISARLPVNLSQNRLMSSRARRKSASYNATSHVNVDLKMLKLCSKLKHLPWIHAWGDPSSTLWTRYNLVYHHLKNNEETLHYLLIQKEPLIVPVRVVLEVEANLNFSQKHLVILAKELMGWELPPSHYHGSKHPNCKRRVLCSSARKYTGLEILSYFFNLLMWFTNNFHLHH